MANLFYKAAKWVAAQTKAHASQSVVYRRGLSVATISATVGRTVYESLDSEGVTAHIESADWLITAADLVLDGQAVTPERNDLIEFTLNGVKNTFKVLPMGKDVPIFTYCDNATQVMIRVHTKLFKQEPV
ncbi:hypothetical protein [Gimesia sp.]|uniref:hypothetical protein n=1 Tax=Gimesia sp. TaxID=2024833 RepID=UPI003A91C129